MAVADLVSLDEDELTEDPQSDGSLPDIDYGHLAKDSDLINVGTDIGDDYLLPGV